MAEKSVTITSRRSDRSFGIFFGRFISSCRISAIVRETEIGIEWLQVVSPKEKRPSESEAPFETTARTEPHRARRALHSRQRNRNGPNEERNRNSPENGR